MIENAQVSPAPVAESAAWPEMKLRKRPLLAHLASLVTPGPQDRTKGRVRPEAALMEKGGMMRQGRCVNALVGAELTDGGDGAAYYDEPVRLVTP